MAKHIWVNQEKLNASKTMRVGGVRFTVSISPFDAPKEIIGEYIQKSGLFVISFKYDNVEPEKTGSVNDGVTFVEGRHSGKLLRILVPVDKQNVGTVEVQTRVMNALHSRRRAFKDNASYARDLNQTVAENVLGSEFKTFDSELVTR